MAWQDIFVRRSLRRIREKTKESELWVNGRFMSDEQMDKEGLTEQRG